MIAKHVEAAGVTAPETTLGFTRADCPAAVDLELTPVGASGWRVTDGRLPAGDPYRLLAFIERRGELFEVMQWGTAFQWDRFESMDAALAFIAQAGPPLAAQRAHGALAWIA